MRVKKYLVLFIIIAIAKCLNAQDLSRHNWFFGDSPNSIRFDRTTNAAQLITKKLNQPFGIGGSGVATDHTNRNLLFYTDGANVYDVTENVMSNGTGLGGATTSNQPVAICPAPGQPNQFFIFARNAAGTVTVSTVDINAGGIFPAPPTGDVIVKNQPVGTGLTNRSEAMILISHPLDTAYWLITHQQNSNDYTVTSITEYFGIVNTVVPNLGFDINAANFSFHEGSSRLAVSPVEANQNIAILNLNTTTGALTFNQFLFNTSSPVASVAEPSVYDTEWSMDGRFLYISRTGNATVAPNLLQFDFANINNTVGTILTSPSMIRSWGVQVAPDSAIYHLYETAGGNFFVGKLTDIDSLAPLTTYTPQAFPGLLNFNAKQFPAFAPKPRLTLNVSFVAQGDCSNVNTTFFPTVTPGADSLVWDLGDGNFSNSWSPVHLYANSGSFPVKVRAFLKGDTASFQSTINIRQFNLQISLVQDTTACSCELPFPKSTTPGPPCGQFSVTAQVSGGPPVSTQWFGPGGILPTQTTTTLQPDSAGYYYVVATDATGCSAHAGVNIKEYGLQEQRANIWYFGNNAGIDFNEGTVPISNPVMNAPEGCSIICDRNGQAIFFTDGNKVWDRNFVELATGIGGDLNATQSVLIMPVEGDETLYYIFTTQEIFGTGTFELRYSLFDLKKNNGVGDVVQQAIPLFAKSTERITGNTNWVIAHEFGNNSFRAYRVSAQGISAPVISSIGSDHRINIQQAGEGYMKLGALNRLAVALSTPAISNVVEIFDFTDSSGVVSNFRTANTEVASGQVYGLEFSPGGNKLFTTILDAPSRVIEFAFDSLANPYLKGQIGTSASNLGAIQIAPDGQIYVASQNQQALGIIAAVEDTTQLSTFTDNSFTLLGGTNSRLGLPNFIQSISTPAQQPSISVTGLCLGSPTVFQGSGTDVIDELTWFFGDGASATGDSATHTYAAAGDYLVSLNITNRCGLALVLTQQITITAPPANPTFLPAGVPQPVLCTGSLLLEATPATNPDLSDLSFIWTTGDVTRTIVVNRQTTVGVTITDVLGCSSNGTILVADNRPQVELGPDLTICEDTPIAPLNAQNPGLTYAWTVNSGSPSANQTRNVVTTAAGIFEYKVTVSDAITTCSVRDSVTFTINQTPQFTATGNTIVCGGTNGQIALNITSTGSYSYFGTGPASINPGTNQTGPAAFSLTPNTLVEGSYGITVQDELSGCPASTIVAINTTAFTVNATQAGTCDPLSISVTHNLGAAAFTYQVLNPSLTAVDNGVSAVRPSPFDTNTIPSNETYVVQLTRTSDGCISSSPSITLTQAAQLTINGFTTACSITNGTEVLVDAPGATTFDWSASQAGSINGSTSTNPVVINANANPWNLIVTVDDGLACPATANFSVTGAAPFTVDLTQTDPCQDQVSLNATPTGSFTYFWTRTPAPNPVAGQTILLSTTDDNATYNVTVRSTVSGCTNTDNLQVNVVGELDVVLSATPPCGETPFTITATSTQVPASTAWSLNGNVINGATTSTLTDTRNGLYTVTVTLDVCTDSEQIQITKPPVVAGGLVNEAIICDDVANPDPSTREITLDPGTDFSSFEWFKDEVALNVFTPTFTATEPGTFSVNLLDVFGCEVTDQTIVIRECDPRIVAPTAFRPGSSNPLTKDFFVYRYFIADDGFQVFIFNRWGEMVFQSNNQDFKWNGGFQNGNPLPAGTYTYVVKFKSSFNPEDGVQEKRGGVLLVR